MNPNIHYPYNNRKYSGCISERVNKNTIAYRYKLDEKGIKENKTFDNYDDAENYLKNKAIQLGFVKNIVYETNGIWEVELTKDQKCLFDEEDLNIIDDHILSISAGTKEGVYYAKARITDKNTKKYLHNLIMNFEPHDGLTVDHINKNTLDNRKCNLRIVDKTIQNINKNPQKSNTSGVVGVHFDISKNSWIANWKENKVRKSKSFSVKIYGDQEAFKLAEEHRKMKENTIPEYVQALGLST